MKTRPNRQGGSYAALQMLAWLCRREHTDIASAIDDVDYDMAAQPADSDIGRAIADLKAAQGDLVEERRQLRLVEANAMGVRVEVHPQTRLQQVKWRCCCPSLWRAGNGIEGRSLCALTRQSAEEFRKPAQVDIGRGRKQACRPSPRSRWRDPAAFPAISARGRQDNCRSVFR
jgi:hypothetical protein